MTMSQPRWGRPPTDNQDTTLILIRHGETTWNVEGRVQGHRNAPLSERGRQQAQHLAQHLAKAKIQAVYSSDSSRALETANLIAAVHRLQVFPSEELRERNYGVIEGKTLTEAARTQGTWFLTWQENRHNAPPAGESQQQMCERIMHALRTIAAAHPGQTVVVSTHGGPVKSAVYEILRIPLALWRLTWIANGSITILCGIPDLMRVACFNDTCHLGAMPSLREEPEG
jgi:broad specificity phosphatase PhoE